MNVEKSKTVNEGDEFEKPKTSQLRFNDLLGHLSLETAAILP